MIRNFIFCFFLLTSVFLSAQIYKGKIWVKDRTDISFTPVYVTNLNTQKTVLCDYKGGFEISAKEDDVVRFTSVLTERKDIRIKPKMLNNENIVHLDMAYSNIPEIVLKRKPTGNFKIDESRLSNKYTKLNINKIIGLPAPKADTNYSSPPFITGFTLNINTIYDWISGDRRRKKRLYEYEQMIKANTSIRKYYGDAYFLRMGIPSNKIDEFLQFVYTSEHLLQFVENNNYETIAVYFDKYLPVFRKRMRMPNLDGGK
ncbi:hypothetical protein [Riemerella columbipharyngis]|uniref:CarboxypepD_reg-like domain-containing protein n=1 Tax=Riemerella columbipharyngis TaxID=1071918 RepID=A0A1G7BND3_9FLAO|nr:hypothetical protein [Riemerella columbipharyngis]SDE28638.1 hypothetical protein SAMN05421544_10662 [Riemerella columbipharyngis]